jgi:type IV secretory pathway VirB10-like protein
MTIPRKYGLQTYAGAVVILMGLGFVGAQLLAPPTSTANNSQAAASRPTPRIIEINTKRDDFKPAEPAKPLEQATAPAPAPAPNYAAVPEPPPVSAAELKRKAQEEADQQTAEMPQEAVNPPQKRSRSRSYPRFDRHAVY